MAIRRLQPGERVPDGEPVRWRHKNTVTCRWLVGPDEHVEMDEHRIVDGIVQPGRQHLSPDPTREELVAAIGPTTRTPDLVEHFGLPKQRIRRLLRAYDIPPFPPGFARGKERPSSSTPTAVTKVDAADIDFPAVPTVPDTPPKTRPRIPLDDACDREHADWVRRNEFHNYRIRRAIEAGPAEPVTLAAGESYKNHAICRGLNPTIFLPETRNAESTALAKRICAVCPVRDVCPVSETTRGRKAKAA